MLIKAKSFNNNVKSFERQYHASCAGFLLFYKKEEWGSGTQSFKKVFVILLRNIYFIDIYLLHILVMNSLWGRVQP